MRDPQLMEEVLKQHLGPVTAPEFGLHTERRDRPRPRIGVTLAWAAFAGLVLLLTPWAGRNQIRSTNPAEVRGWVKARTGEYFALRNGEPPEGVRLTGAYVTGAAAVVTFAVGGRPGTVRVLSHAGGHRYVVEAASAEDEKMACMLCHGTEVN